MPPLAFGVRADLMARGLADIDVSVPLEMDARESWCSWLHSSLRALWLTSMSRWARSA